MGVEVDETQGFKWGGVSCGDCGARGPEVRTGYYIDPGPKRTEWEADAVEEWNKRA